jgi:hypothetical protein
LYLSSRTAAQFVVLMGERLVATAAVLVAATARDALVANWGGVGAAFVPATEFDPAVTALLGVTAAGGSTACTAGGKFNKTEMHPKKAIARAGLDKNSRLGGMTFMVVGRKT